jgi:hypothetical protein
MALRNSAFTIVLTLARVPNERTKRLWDENWKTLRSNDTSRSLLLSYIFKSFDEAGAGNVVPIRTLSTEERQDETLGTYETLDYMS